METTLSNADVDTLRRLALAAECRDRYTGAHMVRTGVLSAFLGAKIGLSPEVVQSLRHSSPMHDLGKIGIPDSILRKPAGLTPEEFEIMKTHTTIGARILENSQNVVLQMGREIALSHHERWDGRGYPNGLSKIQIPLIGRIVGLVDAFDAMTSTRSYRDAKPAEEALEEIGNEKEKQFDPRLVEVFLDNMGHILEIISEMNSSESICPASCFSHGLNHMKRNE
jgi:putative two-component system response regulator